MTNAAVLGVTTMTIAPVSNINFEPAINSIYRTLGISEGSGDNVTTVVTGNLGVTANARAAVRALEDVEDEQAALSYLSYLDQKWGLVEGYRESPVNVQMALLDTSYNLGESVMRFKGVTTDLKEGDYLGVVHNLLDTASVDGKSLKGLAKRRAIVYNMVAADDIFFVKQEEDGTIWYATMTDVVMKYEPKRGRHEKSSAGLIFIPPDIGRVL